MLKTTTIHFLSLAIAILTLSIGGLNAQTVYWGGPTDDNSTFNGGFNDWTPVGIFCDGTAPADSATWKWKVSPTTQGAYGTNQPAFASPTASNGAVIFDSDYLDNNGVAGAFGSGTCPSPHRAELISPIIDMTGNFNIALSFHQFYRRFAGPDGSQQVPGTYIGFSSDGGDTWTEVAVNSAVAVNGATPNGQKLVVNASEFADDNPNFRVKFIFDGEYYFWMIDDVQLEEFPEVYLIAGNFHYTLQNRTQPVDVIHRDTMFFALNVTNNGQPLTVEGTVEIVDTDAEEVIYSQTKFKHFPAGKFDVLEFDDYLLMHDFEIGNYSLRYTIADSSGTPDVDPTTNVRSYPFSVSQNTFQSGSLGASTTLAGISTTGWGYGASFWAPTDPNIEFRISEITTAFAGTGAAGQSSLADKEVSMFLVKKGPDFATTSPSFSGFTEDQMELAGLAIQTLSTADHQVAKTFELERADFEEGPIVLESGEEYFVIALVPFVEGGSIGFMGATTYPSYFIGLNNDGVPFTNSVYVNSRIYNNDAFSGNFGGRAPYYTGSFEIVTSSDAPVLEFGSYNVYPNPASGDFVNLELSFERPMSTNVYITDINGKLIRSYKFDGVQTQAELNISDLSSGTYMVVISNEDGVGTKKVTVVR